MNTGKGTIRRKVAVSALLALVVVALVATALGRGAAHMPDCPTFTACCPEDSPDKCTDDGQRLSDAMVCTQCILSTTTYIGCYYNAWRWDYNGDGVPDCIETCFDHRDNSGCG